jgi:phospholipid/cholesterol/gamma-HCH transport system permease protein
MNGEKKNPAGAGTHDDQPEKDAYSNLPEWLINLLETAGGVADFTVRFFKYVFKPPFEFEEVLNQCFQLGYRSLSLVGLAGFIIGLVLTLQVRPTMVDFGAEAFIPTMISISIVREIGPVLTALICAGKVGSGIGAELSSMKVTEQIDAMEVSGANAFKFTVVTRVLATTLMVPVLVYYASFIALIGGYIGFNIHGEITWSLYFSKAISAIYFSDVIPSTLKSIFFGFAIGIVGCYKGYTADYGTVGVGRAANSAVVAASLLIFIIDLVAVQLIQLFL